VAGRTGYDTRTGRRLLIGIIIDEQVTITADDGEEDG